jgi:hypothetical protein
METAIFFGILWALVCYKMAITRKREPVLAAILGLIFGIFAVIGYAIAGEKK